MIARESRVRGHAVIGINLTPMIDCTFQLIIFFILSTQLANRDLEKILLHRPVESQAHSDEEFVTRSQLHAAHRIYTRAALSLCAGAQ